MTDVITPIGEPDKPFSPPSGVKIENIDGLIQTVSSVPTHTPRTFQEQLVIYKNGSTRHWYWYDSVNNEWRNDQGTTLNADSTGAITGDVTLTSGTDIDLTQSSQDITVASTAHIDSAILAGENIADDDAVCVGGGNVPTKTVSQETEDTDYSYNEYSDALFSNYGVVQTFVAVGNKITKVGVYARESGGSSNVCGIFATSGGVPTGSVLAETGSMDITSGGSPAWAEKDLTSALTVTPGTTYALGLRTVGGSMIWRQKNSNAYSSGSVVTRSPSSSSWSANTSKDFAFRIYEVEGEAGKLYKCDANSSGSLTRNFVGFAEAAANSGNAVTVRHGGIKVLSGLSPGYTYYLSDTAGSISTTAGTVTKEVGLALTSTKLLIKHDNP